MSDQNTMQDPQEKYPAPPFSDEKQEVPGKEADMSPQADHGEQSYRGSGKLTGRKALITGGDSGIGRAVAIAFAREGADVMISYLNEHEDARETARWVEEAGRKCVLMPGDISSEEHCEALIDKAVSDMGGLDILVNNAAYQMSHESLQELETAELDRTFRTNIYAMFWLCKAAERHMKPGSAVINTTSVNAYKPSPELLAYAATKGAIQNFTASLGQLYQGVSPCWTSRLRTIKRAQRRPFGKPLSATGKRNVPGWRTSLFMSSSGGRRERRPGTAGHSPCGHETNPRWRLFPQRIRKRLKRSSGSKQCSPGSGNPCAAGATGSVSG